MAHVAQDDIIFCSPFPNWLWVHQVYCLQLTYQYDLKQVFEEVKYCAHEVCKYLHCRSKNFRCQSELKSPVILTQLGFKLNITSIGLVFSPKRKYLYDSKVTQQNHIITKKYLTCFLYCTKLCHQAGCPVLRVLPQIQVCMYTQPEIPWSE